MKVKKIELIVILVIVIVFVALAAPAILGARDEARQLKDLSNIGQEGIVLMNYANDHDGKFPKSLDELTNGGHSDVKWFKDHKDQIEYFPGHTTADDGTNVLLRLQDGKFVAEYHVNGLAASPSFKTNFPMNAVANR